MRSAPGRRAAAATTTSRDDPPHPTPPAPALSRAPRARHRRRRDPRSHRALAPGARHEHDVVTVGQRLRLACAGLAQQPFHLISLDRTADLAPTERGPPAAALHRRAGTCTARGIGWPPTAPGDTPDQTPHCATTARPAGAQSCRGPTRPRSDRQPLAALGAAALERELVRPGSASARETRARVRACASSAGRCASCLSREARSSGEYSGPSAFSGPPADAPFFSPNALWAAGASNPWYIRRPGAAQSTPLQPPEPAPHGRIDRRLDAGHRTVWQEIRVPSRRASASAPMRSGWRRCVASPSTATRSSSAVPPEVSAWASGAAGAPCARPSASVLGRDVTVAVRRLRRAARTTPAAVAGRWRQRAQPEVHLRAIRDRHVQPPRSRSRARGGRAALPGLQPTLHLRPARPRQDPPAALRSPTT